MDRALPIGCAIVTMMSMIGHPGVAQASPLDNPAQCTFVLVSPHVTQMPGANYVTATVKAASCPLEANPNFASVCISVDGDDAPDHCVSDNIGNPATVNFPYRPGRTYVVKGQGCASMFAPPYTVCQNLGPSRMVL
jgi:hypothetical protein